MKSNKLHFSVLIGFVLLFLIGYSLNTVFNFDVSQFLFVIFALVFLLFWFFSSRSLYRGYVVGLVVFFGLFYYTDATLVFLFLRKAGMSILFSSSFQLALISLLAAFTGFLIQRYVQKK